MAIPPPALLTTPLIEAWLREDIGRGDRTTQALFSDSQQGQAKWVCKEAGVIAGLAIAPRVFQILDPKATFTPLVPEGTSCTTGQPVAEISGPVAALLTGERVALNLAMRLSGIATATRQYVEAIAHLPTQLVDTRKTTPGLRLLEKYATQVGGAQNHRMGLDDAVMIKDNHITAAGGIAQAAAQVRRHIPYPLAIEVETESLAQVKEALASKADIIMLDNMPPAMMKEAVQMIRGESDRVKIEASGNVTLETICTVAETGVDYVSTSAPITRSRWLDLSMRMDF
ncbi:MAG: carboxylating nicotinate-nucleotide diphosphorylase [Cyanobacteria bacterium P01_A01_bin.135]